VAALLTGCVSGTYALEGGRPQIRRMGFGIVATFVAYCSGYIYGTVGA